MPGWMMKDWMPSMLKDQFNISQGKAGVSAGLYVNLAGFVGLFIGGYCSDRWVRRHLRGRTFVSAIGMATLIPALYGLGHSQNLSVAIVFLALFGLGFGLYDCNNMPILSQLVRPESRATGYGIMNFLSVSVGGFADIGVGKLKDQGASFETILGIGAILVAINVFLILQVKPKKELTPELEQ
jgi:MFS family permease